MTYKNYRYLCKDIEKLQELVTYFRLFGLIFGIHLLAVMSPGPDFVMVLKNALQYKRKAAIYTALGIGLGIGVHILYSIAGVAYLLQKNQTLFYIVKIAGALYIIYVGAKTFMSKQAQIKLDDSKKTTVLSPWQAVQTGFVTNVLNPKASLFFLSLFTLLIPPNVPVWVLTAISLMLITVTFLWFSLVSVIFTNKRVVQSYEKYETYIVKVFGLLLIILGIAVFFE